LLNSLILLLTTLTFLVLIVRMIYISGKLKYLSNNILIIIFSINGFIFLRYFFIKRIESYYSIEFPFGVLHNSTVVCALPMLGYLYAKSIIFDQRALKKIDFLHLIVFIGFCGIYEYPYKTLIYNGTLSSNNYVYWSTYFRADQFPKWVEYSKIYLNFIYIALTYALLFKYFSIKYSVILASLTFLGLAIYINRNRNILYNIPAFMDPNSENKEKIKEILDLKVLYKEFTNEIEINELFLNKEFNLKWLAKTLDIKAKHISFAIVECGFENFSAYSNHFKIRKAKDLLTSNYLKKHSISALSDASGFHAVNSFHRVFKKATGSTPKNYSERVKKKAS
jgi:AraC-like DNA-binding protein